MSNDPQLSTGDDDDFDKAYRELEVRIAGEGPAAFVSEESDDEDTSEGGDSEVEAAPTVAAEDDPLKDVPEAVKKLVASERTARLAAEHAARSNAGRVSALQRKLDEVQRTPRSDSAGGSNAPDGENGDDEGDPFGKDYPEVSDFVERRVKKLIAPVMQEAEEKKAKEDADAEAARIASAFKTIADAHPDFDQIRHDPNYGKWLARQAPMIQAMAGSEDPADAIALCDHYKLSTKGPQRNSRQDLIEAAEEIPSKGGARRNGVPDDFDAAIDHYANQSKTKR